MKVASRLRPVVLLLALLAGCVLVSAGCMPGSGSSDPSRPAGFFMGVWHGWIAPLSLIVGFFNPAIRLYETANRGWGYDFGFYVAIISGFGGLSLFRRKNRKD